MFIPAKGCKVTAGSIKRAEYMSEVIFPHVVDCFKHGDLHPEIAVSVSRVSSHGEVYLYIAISVSQ